MKQEWIVYALVTIAFVGPFIGFVTGFAACFRVLHWMEKLDEK